MIDFIISKHDAKIMETGWVHTPLCKHFSLWSEKIDFEIRQKDKRLIIIGDCINCEDIRSDEIRLDQILQLLKGNFYAIYFDGSSLFILSSNFGLLPAYYYQDFSMISSSVEKIKRHIAKPLNVCKKWMINQLLFNFQFGDETYFKEIKLFPAFSYLELNHENSRFNKYYHVKDQFLLHPIKLKKALPGLSKEFIEKVNQYFPDHNSIISFTGGFDGRTLVSIGTWYNKSFSTFSYGKITNDDVYIPLSNAQKLGIPYFWIDLNNHYSQKEYCDSASNYIKKTDGANGFLYAHVNFLASVVREKGDHLISGICGSEIFRAAHSSGAVTSIALLDLFQTDDFFSYRDRVLKSEAFKYIHLKDYFQAIEEVINETWSYKLELSKTLDKNKSLYVFVYEEIFRKFFGSWVKSQMYHIPVRTPYLDFQFFQKIIKTELCGAYSDFLTENPLKRFKGQVFYAEVIKRTNKKLFWTRTGKGYPPAFVNIPVLRPLLALPFISKRVGRRFSKTDFDNLGIISGIKNSESSISNIFSENFDLKKLLVDLNNLKNTDREAYRDTILMCCSILSYQHGLKNGQ